MSSWRLIAWASRRFVGDCSEMMMRAVFFGACAERNEGRETLENVKKGGRGGEMGSEWG